MTEPYLRKYERMQLVSRTHTSDAVNPEWQGHVSHVRSMVLERLKIIREAA